MENKTRKKQYMNLTQKIVNCIRNSDRIAANDGPKRRWGLGT